MTTTVATVALTAEMVASATGARLVARGAGQAFDGVSTDSRTIPAGALFIALRGDRFDGHDFLAAAIERGAGGVLIANDAASTFRDSPKVSATSSVLAVPDTLVALQSLARENPASARVVQIRDTLSLEVMRVSTAYENELSKRTDVVALGSESEMRFDAEGCLVPVDGIAVRMKS